MECSSGMSQLKNFRVHTGNINGYGELKMKRYKNSAEELVASLTFLFDKHGDRVNCSKDGTISFADTEDSRYDRNDLKITLKIFMSNFSFSQITECISSTLDELHVDNIEQLIVAFPETEAVEGESDDEEVARWLSSVEPIWRQLELLVDKRLISAIGVADLQVEQLKAICEVANVKPCINHFNIEGCCVVPPELQAYAHEHDIQLLTHNDPRPFPTSETFQAVCSVKDYPICDPAFQPTWSARYTTWVQKRSIIAAKGYIVQFERFGS